MKGGRKMGKKTFPSLTKHQLIGMYQAGEFTDPVYTYQPLVEEGGFERVYIVKFVHEPHGSWVLAYYEYGATREYFLAKIRRNKKGSEFITFLDGMMMKLQDFKQIGGDTNDSTTEQPKG